MTDVFAVSTNKGGVLKTTISVSIAGVLARKGYRVLIVDTDNQGNVYLSFGSHPDDLYPTVYDVMLGNADVDDAIVSVDDNLDVLPSNDNMSFFDFDVLTNLKKYPNPFKLLDSHIQQVRGRYDYIILDTPPNLGLTQGNVLSAVDRVLIPFQPEVYSMRSLGKMLKSIQSFKEEQNDRLEVLGVIATLVDFRTNLHKDVLREAVAFCKENEIQLFDTFIPRAIAYASNIAYEGKPLTLGEKSRMDRIYTNLVGEIFNV